MRKLEVAGTLFGAGLGSGSGHLPAASAGRGAWLERHAAHPGKVTVTLSNDHQDRIEGVEITEGVLRQMLRDVRRSGRG